MKKQLKRIVLLFMGVMLTPLFYLQETFATAGISLSPMHEYVMLVPGEKHIGSFTVANSSASNETVRYMANIVPFYISDDEKVELESVDGYNQLVDWIHVENNSGILQPNQTATIHYSIDVPNNAPAGGQYAMIRVATVNNDDVKNEDFALNIDVSYGIGYLIYGNVAGTTVKQGEIFDIDVPGFLLSGNINAHSSVRNTGNIHGGAKYTLQVYPLFSNEEVYTNEENPSTSVILPNRTLYREIVWDQTPSVGIFNVVYTVEFEGVTQQVKKMVIKCPIWLLFIIIFAIVALIIWLVLRAKNRGNKRRAEA